MRGLGATQCPTLSYLRLQAPCARANEILAKAETMTDAEARREMREVAAGYERLAHRVEKEISRIG